METPRLISVDKLIDNRGYFQKILSQDKLRSIGIPNFEALEMFSTSTKKYGVRGMHVQISPQASRKIVWVTEGEIIDVVVDIQSCVTRTFKLSAKTSKALYVPANFAHGFQVLTKRATVNYLTDAEYSRECDVGFHVKSFGYQWPKPIRYLSERDQKLQDFREFHDEF